MTTYTPWERIEATDAEIAANVPTHKRGIFGIRVRRSQFERARDHERFVTHKSNVTYVRSNFQPGIQFTYLGCKGRVLSICSSGITIRLLTPAGIEKVDLTINHLRRLHGEVFPPQLDI